MESRKKTYHPKSIDFITLPFESQSTQYLLSSSLSKAFSTDWHLSWSCLTLSFSVFRLIWIKFIQETPEKKTICKWQQGGCHLQTSNCRIFGMSKPRNVSDLLFFLMNNLYYFKIMFLSLSLANCHCFISFFSFFHMRK